MDAQSSTCLSDLVPAIRWTRPQQVAELLADPRLPGGWWGSVTIGRALAVTGADWICDRLARLAVARWGHLSLVEVLPALQVHTPDPALPGWPDAVRTAAGGIGGWFRLRRLTPSDLQSPTGPASAEAVVSTALREFFGRLPVEGQATGALAPAPPTVPGQSVPSQSGPGQSIPGQSIPGQSVPSQSGPGQSAAPPVPAQSVPAQSVPAQSAPVPALAAPVTGAEPIAPPAPPAVQPNPATLAAEYPMVGMVETLLRDWTPLEKAIAAERLFAAEPISLRALAYRLEVDREVLSQAQRSAEERVLMWMRSPDSAPLTGHLFGLTEWLGAAATQEQLISVDPSHPVLVPSLGTPLWRVLVALMPDRRLQDGWLVVGDLTGLQEKTRRLLAANPGETDVVELLSQIGIRSHSAKAWLEALPKEPGRPPGHGAHEAQSPAGVTTTGGMPALPRRTPGANGHHRGGRPVPQVGNTVDPQTALAALSALSGGTPPPRPHLVQQSQTPPPVPGPAADPRRWQRIDVTHEHLRGAPVAVPENYAAQLGMRPGTLLSVTGPGDNAVVLVWRDRQPVFDSLQPVLMRLNARPGDSVYVTVNGYRLDAQLTS